FLSCLFRCWMTVRSPFMADSADCWVGKPIAYHDACWRAVIYGYCQGPAFAAPPALTPVKWKGSSPVDCYCLQRQQGGIVGSVELEDAFILGFSHASCILSTGQVVAGRIAAATTAPAHTELGFEVGQ